MSKMKTLLDFFSKSPASSSPSPKATKSSVQSPVSTSKKSTKNSFAESPSSASKKSTSNSLAESPASLSKESTKNSQVESPDSTSKKANTISSTEIPVSTPKNSSCNGKSKHLKSAVKRRTSLSSEEDSESEAVKHKKGNSSAKVKRRRIVIASDSDDSEDEYRPEKESVSSDDSASALSDNLSETGTPKKKRKKLQMKTPLPSLNSFKNPKISSPITSTPTNTPSRAKVTTTPSSCGDSKKSTPVSKKKSSNISNDASEESVLLQDFKEWTHEKLDFLREEKLRDKCGKPKSDPSYNSRTLLVPESFKKNLTPAMKQWWDMKADHFDTVLFFKVGKFYELYHMDAVIGVKELGLVFMKGEFAHSGFPEIAFGRYSELLVEKGYKIARIEQTETPQLMEERCRKMLKPTKYDKVVNREICQITTKGTRTLTYQDEPMCASNNFLLALCEKHSEADSGSEYGICFVDTTIGKFSLGQFEDDRHGSRIMTLIALYPPAEILYEKSSVSKKTLQLLNNNLNSVSKEALNSSSQFQDSAKVLKFLSEGGYFTDKSDSVQWPEVIEQMLDDDDMLQQTALKQYELAFKSLGACIWYLKECCIEDSILTMKLFEEYNPLDGLQTSANRSKTFAKQHMVLDGVTLSNLEIVPLLHADNAEGTLFGTMDYCSSNFGKRLFRHWLCSPLCNPKSISDRLDAVDDLSEIPDVVDAAISQLKKLPDLERLLSKIHTQGLLRSQDHPDTRAIYYEADIYNKKKLVDFSSTLDGFKESMKIVSQFEPYTNSFKSCLLKECVTTTENGGRFPEMSKALSYFDHAFDKNLAKKEGNIIPSAGVDKEYDAACAEIKDTEEELDYYLEQQKSKLQCKVSYVGSGRTRFQLEVPDNKKVPSNFEFQGARKGFKRFYTDETREFYTRMAAAEESRDLALRDVSRRIFAHFDKNYNMWKSAVHCLSVVDALMSLHLYKKTSEVPMCRPEFSLPSEDIEPHLEIIEGRHPTFLKYFTGDAYIPNSVYLGPKKGSEAKDINNGGRLVLVTGPNMGGKSTLMRQAGTLVIMAHMGSYVPAEFMRLTPVDRIFTRVGASDRISKGESTFFVEASETASILHHATSDSFVLVDELGRGTATHDGTAIAHAVLDFMANKIGCRTLFSTHYHSLVEDFLLHPTVGLGHMACMAEEDSDSPLEKITFLYKFIEGACPKSYGFNVALLAGISKEVVRQGFLKAQEMEYQTRISKSLRYLLTVMKPDEIVNELEKLR